MMNFVEGGILLRLNTSAPFVRQIPGLDWKMRPLARVQHFNPVGLPHRVTLNITIKYYSSRKHRYKDEKQIMLLITTPKTTTKHNIVFI